VIRLFVTDLDGCLSHPFQPPAWEALLALVRLQAEHPRDPTIPPLTLCTGRPLAYAEAVAQWLGVTRPIVFESGSGMYDPVANRVSWSPAIDARTEATLARLRQRIHGELVGRFPGTVAELGKQKDVGLIHPDARVIASLVAAVTEIVREDGDDAVEIHHTSISVSAIPRAANKGAGLAWLADCLGLPLAALAYIGDSGGDIPALRRAGMAFAPANAADEVKALATVTRGEATAGVLEAYQAVIAHNRRITGAAESHPPRDRAH
jgi:hydroxymethylpyrimidine pyrophosphatase-like HAD family hydrolase